jgi:hypothetical protein
VFDTIAAAQLEELKKDIVSLQTEAEQAAEEARELAGEVPFWRAEGGRNDPPKAELSRSIGMCSRR